jgi:hypothetical protein
MLRYHGGGSPAGVAMAFQVLARALPLLAPEAPLERRELAITTAFPGPGARDGFELVTRAVSDRRYTIDAELAPGIVDDEFVTLAGRDSRSDAEEERFTELKWSSIDEECLTEGSDATCRPLLR